MSIPKLIVWTVISLALSVGGAYIIYRRLPSLFSEDSTYYALLAIFAGGMVGQYVAPYTLLGRTIRRRRGIPVERRKPSWY
jgi:hypothetical protein